MFDAENYTTEELRDANPIVAMLALGAASLAQAGDLAGAQDALQRVRDNHGDECAQAAEVLFARYYAVMELRRVQAS
jgi:hypothetical protein